MFKENDGYKNPWYLIVMSPLSYTSSSRFFLITFDLNLYFFCFLWIVIIYCEPHQFHLCKKFDYFIYFDSPCCCCIATMEASNDPQAHPNLSVTLVRSAFRSKQILDLEFECLTYGVNSFKILVFKVFMVAVLRNNVFLKIFTTWEILNFKLVCKSWKAWFVHNATTTIEYGRKQDDIRDCTFHCLSI